MARATTRKGLRDDGEYPEQPARNQTRTLPKPPKKRRTKKSAAAAELKRLDAAFGLGPRPKVKRVAKDVLTTTTISADTQAIYKRNADESRLLKLPSEIRNYIFSLAFGHNTVHVYGKAKSTVQLTVNHKLCRSICVRDQSEEQDAEEIKYAHETTNQLGYHERHSKCKHRMHASSRKTKSTMNLQVLAVCRRIHDEFSLMPYEQSTFSFGWILDLEAFVEHLIPTQVGAVQNLSFVYHTFNSDKHFEMRLAEKLKALKTLTIFVQVSTGPVATSVQTGYFEDARRTERLTEGVLRFQRFPVEKASVVAYNAPTRYGSEQYEKGSAQVGMLDVWGKQVEEKLMAKYEGEDADEDEEVVEDEW